MTFKQYEPKAQRTSNHNLKTFQHLSNGLTGIIGECGEVMEFCKKVKYMGHPFEADKLEKELGDVFWYIVEFKSGFNKIYARPYLLDDLIYNAQMPISFKDEDVVDKIEKLLPQALARLLQVDIRNIYEGNTNAIMEEEIAKRLRWFVDEFCDICNVFETPDEIMTENIKKLEKRYPEKFSTEDSVNRSV